MSGTAGHIACASRLYLSNRAHRPLPAPKVATLELRKRRLQVGTAIFSRKGSLQCQATAASPSAGQSDTELPSLPDISLLSSELQQQWHVEGNMHLGAIRVKPQSNMKALWQCNKCPAGQPHIWTATVKNRTRGGQCPNCTNQHVCLHNSLATIAPEAVKFWNQGKNAKTPDQVSAGSQFRAEWKCPACNCEWQARVSTRLRNNAGCPKCRLEQRQRQPTFAKAQPACLAQWDYEHNDIEDIYPDKITLGSGKLVHWVCSCCPRGQTHRWTAPPYSRIGQGTGCPVCVGHQVCVCNSLESLLPSLAGEFDVAKNGFAPSEITAQSAVEVWWRNSKRGSWRQAPNSRIQWRNGTGQEHQAGVASRRAAL